VKALKISLWRVSAKMAAAIDNSGWRRQKSSESGAGRKMAAALARHAAAQINEMAMAYREMLIKYFK
jgi:hypothetical protein